MSLDETQIFSGEHDHRLAVMTRLEGFGSLPSIDALQTLVPELWGVKLVITNVGIIRFKFVFIDAQDLQKAILILLSRSMTTV